MPLNFTSSTELPPLHPENPTLSSSKSIEDTDDISKTNTWYGQFIQTCNSPVTDEKIHLLMLDFLITEGFQEIAMSFAKEAGIDYKPDEIRNACHLPERDAIRNAVLKGQARNCY
ncbi:hypothetical protein M3Y97_00029600 [Aphelenchoides bicaudatus]|nr:hypothetical protein M3Y97_00029600 [Aphelenchoides bicaudatus]